MNYVMCECKNVMLYLTSYTIGTYGYSSKSVALRLLIKHSCWVGAVLITIKPHNNIDDGSTTFKVIDRSNIINNDKVSYC
jgi:hypothetical protein